MAKQLINNIKLGMFITAGIIFLVILLYMIGKDQNLFSSNIQLKARFNNAQGLVTGNNVRYSGIQVGTVKKVLLLNDTTVEVLMLIEEKQSSMIRRNAVVSIGTEGFIGNKIVNIIPGKGIADPIQDGDMLTSKKIINTDEMLETLAMSNRNVAFISEDLKQTVRRINNSSALWRLLNDNTLPDELRRSAINIRKATDKANSIVNNLDDIIASVKNGEGSLGAVIKDTSFARNLNDALLKIKKVGDDADHLANNIDSLINTVQYNINSGTGVVTALLKDSSIVQKLQSSLDNIEEGTDGFNQNMEALKHNFLFRGYFRKLERQQQKEAKAKAAEKN